MHNPRPSPLPARGSSLPLLVLATLAGCSGPPAPPAPDLTARTEQPIEGGHSINDAADPISSLFPVSTVNVRLNADTVAEASCTGVLIAPTKVLTADHCTHGNGVLPDDLTVTFYSTKVGGSAAPVNSTAQTVPQSSVARPPNVTCAGYTDGPPASCFNNGVFADLSVLTLPTAVGAPWKPAWLAPRGSIASFVAAKRSPATWAVGTGYMNIQNLLCEGYTLDQVPESVRNPGHLMMWTPIAHFSNGGATGIITDRDYADPGDSGGPLYLYAGSGQNLAVAGIVSGGGHSCSIFTAGDYSRYSDVTEPSNYAWLVSQGATEAPGTPSFGAAL